MARTKPNVLTNATTANIQLLRVTLATPLPDGETVESIAKAIIKAIGDKKAIASIRWK